MQFAIISAGEGSRLKEEGVNKPKALAEVNGSPLISYVVDNILEYSDTIHIIVNEASTEILDYLALNYPQMKIVPIVKSTPSSLHSLYELTRILPKDDFVLFTVDSIFKIEDFRNFVDSIKNEPADAVIAVTPFIDDEKPLYVKVNDKGLIRSFDDVNDGHKYVTGGIYYLSHKTVEIAEKSVLNGIRKLRNFQRALLENKMNVKAFVFDKIIDVDHVKDIKQAEEFLSGSSFKQG